MEQSSQPFGLRLSEELGCNAQAVARERAVLFSAPMVRALLDGTKTQTRRQMSVQPHDGAEVVCDDFYPTVIAKNGDEEPGPEVFGAWWSDGEEAVRCPYGKPGERLWVREAWRTDPQFDCLPPRDLDPAVAPVQYEAGPHADVLGGKLRPSMFMPRWACRLVLTLESVRVERLHDISRGDAMAEGCTHPNMAHGPDPRRWYAELWNQINGPGAWDANPWVWVLAFRCGSNLQPNVRAEKLAIDAVRRVQRFGGVLEHPAESTLWAHMGLPTPGRAPDAHGGWTAEVRQCDWGHKAEKLTWLYVVGCHPDNLPPMPLRGAANGGDKAAARDSPRWPKDRNEGRARAHAACAGFVAGGAGATLPSAAQRCR